MKLTFEKRIIITLAILFLCIIGIIFGLIIPAVRYIRSADNSTYNLRLYLERRHERSISFRTAVQRYEKVKNQITDFDAYIFHNGQELELITSLENTAQKNKVKQQIINSNLDKPANQKITISLAVSGDYHDVLNYLVDIERLKVYLTVNRLQLAKGTDPDTRAGVAILNLDLSLYVAP